MKAIQVYIRILAFCCAAVFLVATDGVLAQEWPQWRGENRDGIVTDFSIPQSWPESLELKWKVPVGTGYASPVVVDGRIYILSRNDEQEQEVVSCLDLATGGILWQETYPVLYTPDGAAARHGRGPKSTPVLHGGRLFTLGITGILSSFDADTGNVNWRKDFAGEFTRTYPVYGTAMSPVVDKGLLIFHIGSQDQGALMACDAETGEIKWRWDGDGPAYASPIVGEFQGVRQIVTQSQNHCVGVSADTGELFWSIPFTTDYDQNIVTPVLYGQMVIFSGLKKGATAVRIVKQGDEWTTERIWHNPDASMYMSSPVVSDDLLFGFSRERGGHFFCLNAQTGETLWKSDGRQGENAAILGTGDILLALMNDAWLIVIEESSESFEPITRYKVADRQTWAHPAPLGKQIFVKDVSELYLWSIK